MLGINTIMKSLFVADDFSTDLGYVHNVHTVLGRGEGGREGVKRKSKLNTFYNFFPYIFAYSGEV